jgi:hypothetical protein
MCMRESESTLLIYSVAYSTLFVMILFNVGNVLLCVVYQLNFSVFMYVT